MDSMINWKSIMYSIRTREYQSVSSEQLRIAKPEKNDGYFRGSEF